MTDLRCVFVSEYCTEKVYIGYGMYGRFVGVCEDDISGFH